MRGKIRFYKKILAAVLTACMVCSCLYALPASAEETVRMDFRSPFRINANSASATFHQVQAKNGTWSWMNVNTWNTSAKGSTEGLSEFSLAGDANTFAIKQYHYVQYGDNLNFRGLLPDQFSNVPIPLDKPLLITMDYHTSAEDSSKAANMLTMLRMRIRATVDGTKSRDVDLETTPISATESCNGQQTVQFYIDPVNGEYVSFLNGKESSKARISTNMNDLEDAYLFLCSYAKDGKTNYAALPTAFSWSVESIKVVEGAEKPKDNSEVEPPTPPTGEKILFMIDKQMSLTDNKNGTFDWADAASGDKSTVIDWGGTITGRTISSDGNTLILPQTKTTRNNLRIPSADFSAVTLSETYNISLKFKVSADDYSNVPELKTRMIVANAWTTMNTHIPLTESTADKWQTLTYSINPEDHTIIGTLDGKEVARGSFATSVTTLGTPQFQLVTQNPGTANDKETEAGELTTSPVTWTIDYFKISTGSSAGPETPDPDPKNEKLLIDDNMTKSGNTISQVGSIMYEYYNAGNDINASNELIDNNTKFQFKQSLSSAYKQRLTVTDPKPITLDAPITATLKFRVKADDYSKGTTAKMTFTRLAPPSNHWFLEMGNTIPLSMDTEKITQTLVYTIDPDTWVVTGKLNGTQVVQGTIPDKPSTITQLSFFPVVQAAGQNGKDATDLGTTVTWTFDSFEIKKGSESEEPVKPTPLPLEHPVSSGTWQSPIYAEGVGDSEANQLSGTIVDLGKIALVNKIVLEHDPSKVMSFSVSCSCDGLSYTPITNIYAGGVAEYGGIQTYYFAPTAARYIKYNTVLIKDAPTQGILNNMTISHTEITNIDLIDIPSCINPLESREIRLCAVLTDKEGETYSANPQGIIWSIEGQKPEGVELYGSNLILSPNTANGTILLKATDAAGKISQTKTVQIKSSIAVRNFALYADASLTQPLTNVTPNATVYVNAEILADSEIVNKDVQLILAAHDGNIIKASATAATTANSDNWKPISTSLKLPADFNANGTLNAYLWNSSMEPLCLPIHYGNGMGIQARNVFLSMHDERQLSVPTDNVTWYSSDPRIAAVGENGKVSAKSEGFATITAKREENVIGSVRVQVKPSTYVYLMIGQSNTSGTNNPVLEGLEVPISSNVKLLNNEGKFEPAQHPYRRYSGVNYIGDGTGENGYMGWADATDKVGPEQGINMGYQFAENMAKANPDINIGMVVNSSSGSQIISFEKNSIVPNANGFENTVMRMNQALAGDAEFKGLLWHQGESDQLDASYPRRLRNLIYDLRTALGTPEAPLILGQLNETNRPAAVPHNVRVRGELARIPNMSFVSAMEPAPLVSRAEHPAYKNDSATWQKDYTHFSATAQIEFGNRYYQAYLTANGNRK